MDNNRTRKYKMFITVKRVQEFRVVYCVVYLLQLWHFRKFH